MQQLDDANKNQFDADDHKVTATDPIVSLSQSHSKAGKREEMMVSSAASPFIWRVFFKISQQISPMSYWSKLVICSPLAAREAGKMTRWPGIRELEIERALHGMAVWALLTPVEIIFLSAFLTRPWEPSGQGLPPIYCCPQNLAHCSALRRCSINSHWMNKWVNQSIDIRPPRCLAYTTKSPSIGNYLFICKLNLG